MKMAENDPPSGPTEVRGNASLLIVIAICSVVMSHIARLYYFIPPCGE